MHAHYLQHVPFEGLGSIEPWLKANGFSVENHYSDVAGAPFSSESREFAVVAKKRKQSRNKNIRQTAYAAAADPHGGH